MRIFGIGIDVVEVGRIASAIDRHGEPFLAKLFTTAERAYCDGHKIPALHYAARFAAKEAIAKALGTGIGAHVGWLEMEITRDSQGAPKVALTGTAAAFASENQIAKIHISLTHAREYAAANAVVMATE